MTVPDGRQRPEMAGLDVDTIREELDIAEATFALEEQEIVGQGSDTLLSRGVARLGGVEIHFIHEKPHEQTDPITVVIEPGYLGIRSAYRRLRHGFAAQGKAAVTFHSVRWAGLGNLISLRHLLHPELLPAMATHAVVKAVNEETTQPADLSSHSWGGPAAITEAEHDRDRIRSIVLTASAGMDKHGLIDMRARGHAFFTKELWPARHQLSQLYEPLLVRQLMEYALKNVQRTAVEGIAAGRYFMVDRVAQLVQSGLPIAAQQFPYDHLFPLDAVRVNGHVVSIFDVFPVAEAGHIAPQLLPDAVALSQIDLFEKLNSKEDQHAHVA